MTRKRWIYLIGAFALIVLVTAFWSAKDRDLDLPRKVDFNYHIRPILSQNCFVCHGNDPESREAGLRLDTREGATAILEEGGSAIVPGSPGRSSLVARVASDDPDFRMPPPEAKKILSEREVALLEKWIAQGAEYKAHWAFVKPEMPRLSKEMDEASTSTTIDFLIEEKLKNRKLAAAPKAERGLLIRRVSYLLTGLPPSVEELHQFLADNGEDWYEKLIDHYLASPAFGERWARHWMDLVRYGESMGHEGDFNISHPWEYRDYLIRAFNQDVPYDLFVKEHLAGDMLENPRYHPEENFNESMIGTGYFFLGEGKHAPVDIKLEEADKIDNMIDVTSKTFQGLTVACARCHDHKFDPILAADYYSMYGMIESSRLVPKQARQPANQQEDVERLRTLKGDLKETIHQILASRVEETGGARALQIAAATSQSAAEADTSYSVVADFRSGSWNGWYTEGIAFGDAPLNGEIMWNKKGSDFRLASGYASSRALAPGLQGVLHSPYFTIEHDSILIRARGRRGMVRIIIDNFQVIQGPLWDWLEQPVEGEQWKNYMLDVHLAKGHKAYLEFFPGMFDRHIYGIEPEDYIEIQYAVGFSGDHPLRKELLSLPKNSSGDLAMALAKWKEDLNSPEEASELNNLLMTVQKDLDPLKADPALVEYREISKRLFDSTHYIGMAEGDPVFSSIFKRGSHHNLTDEEMPHGFFHFIDLGDQEFPQTGSGRLAWAEAVLDDDNPLTTRVIVNRIWHHLFGRGIVETVDNFGLQGMLPSHPELLDYLAISFRQGGWSIKGMLKQIMLSETFQRSTIAPEQSREVDPQNIYLSHFPVRRLEAEAIRDGILAVSGCLNPEMYGESIPVYLSDFMTGRGRPKVSGPMDGMGRRSVYIAVRRNFIPPMMLTFDKPIPFSTFGKRNTTNVPAQSLTLLNDPFIHDHAYYWAEHILRLGDKSVEDRITMVYLAAFSRQPSTEEIAQGIEFLTLHATDLGSSLDLLKDDPDLWKEYCHSIINLKEFIHLL